MSATSVTKIALKNIAMARSQSLSHRAGYGDRTLTDIHLNGGSRSLVEPCGVSVPRTRFVFG